MSGGTNFCLFTKYASAVELLLFDEKAGSTPTQVFRLSPKENKTFYYWHVSLSGVGHGQHYGWRVRGPYVPNKGFRYDHNKVLIDPYARAVQTEGYDRQAAITPGDNTPTAIKSVVVDVDLYDWEGDRPVNHPFSKTIIYELHVGGFTKHPSSGLPERLRGTYRGLIEKIPYLKSLGITAVELLPIQQFDPYDVPDQSLTNYWGYSPIAFFAPHMGYSSTGCPLHTVDEFRDMVKALHQADIEVILDVVFNHTGEGDAQGPTLSMRGIEDRAYYMHNKSDYSYKNFAGTGNTLNANHSVVRRLILDCLRYWVSEMHVDGFRFDLAAVLSRDENGMTTENPPILWEIESDPVLASTKLIAEAWDVQQYQLGSFIGDKWAEWNGAYRDDLRRFVKGNEHTVATLAQRLQGSPDLFRGVLRSPNRSINFITCHDGFTLNDLVSYNQKHNWANGEENRDGHNDNQSWNCGIEGPTDDPAIEALRLRQIKNFHALLLLSQGTPMMLMGDELRRSQGGNNNAYCQDNPISWLDWGQIDDNKEVLDFFSRFNHFNLDTAFFQEDFYWNSPNSLGASTCIFHGTSLYRPDFGDHSRSLAFTLSNSRYDYRLHVLLNAYWEDLVFELPHGEWHRIVDTAAAPPYDFVDLPDASKVKAQTLSVTARSVVVLKT